MAKTEEKKTVEVATGGQDGTSEGGPWREYGSAAGALHLHGDTQRKDSFPENDALYLPGQGVSSEEDTPSLSGDCSSVRSS